LSNIFIIISSFFAVISGLPYIRDVYLRKSKPREVSWITWGLLAAIAAAASFSDHQYSSAILSLWVVVITWTIAILGIKYGDRTFKLLDGICLGSSAVGLILWWAFNSPSIAIIASLSIDLVAAIPTFVHSWQKPNEETISSYFLGLFASLFSLLAAKDFTITAVASPIYYLIGDAALVFILVTRTKSILNKNKH